MRPLEPGEIFAADFRVESLLGHGGMGWIYVATQLSTGKRRALKLPALFEYARRLGSTRRTSA